MTECLLRSTVDEEKGDNVFKFEVVVMNSSADGMSQEFKMIDLN